MNIAVILQNIKDIYDIKDYINTVLIPIKNFSINYPNTFTLEDVKKIKEINKEIFLIVNKNMYNEELEDLKTLLKEIEKLDIKGIIFYDMAILKLKNDLNLKTDLVWSQEHMVNSYGTINYYHEKGIKYAYLSSELSKDEIKEIKENSLCELFINVFGHIPMFTSRRHLVNNYIDYFNLSDKGKNKKIHKEDKYYPIIDEKDGTTVYSNYILNILDEDFLNDFYLVFNPVFIDNLDFKQAVKNFKEKRPSNFPYEHGFLDEETIYKVKNND